MHCPTYHSFYYTSRGELAGIRNSLVGPVGEIDHITDHTMRGALPLTYTLIQELCEKSG